MNHASPPPGVQATFPTKWTMVPEPALLWGQSLGANVSIGATAQVPELVRAVVLEEPAIETDDLGPSEPLIRGMWEMAKSCRPADEIMVALAELPMDVPGLDEPVRLGDVRDEEYLRLMAECLSRLDPEVMAFILDMRLTAGYDGEALLQQVTCPALFLHGEPAMGGLEDGVASRAADLPPRGRRVKIPRAGHNVHVTQPEAALQAVGEFLESVGGCAG